MPASKLSFFVSTLHWDTGVFPTDVREVVEPNLPAAPLFADAVRGVDVAYEKAISYKEGDRLADRLVSIYKPRGSIPRLPVTTVNAAELHFLIRGA